MNDICFSVAGIGVMGGLLTVLSGTVMALFKLLQAAKDQQIAALTIRADSYERLAKQSVNALEAVLNARRAADHEPPMPVVPPVLPQHSSPVTVDQQADADLETLKARAAAARRALGLPLAVEPGEA